MKVANTQTDSIFLNFTLTNQGVILSRVKAV